MKYLGVVVGPGRKDSSWTAPIQRYTERARFWGSRGLGMLTTLQAYRVFVSSTLQFVARLEDPPANFKEEETRAVRLILTGPAGWITAACAKDLKAIHFPEQLVAMTAILLVSKARVQRFEASAMGGLRIAERPRYLPRQGSVNCSLNCSLAR